MEKDKEIEDIIGRNVKRPPYNFCNILDVWSFRVTTNPFMKLFFENYDWKRRKDYNMCFVNPCLIYPVLRV